MIAFHLSGISCIDIISVLNSTPKNSALTPGGESSFGFPEADGSPMASHLFRYSSLNCAANAASVINNESSTYVTMCTCFVMALKFRSNPLPSSNDISVATWGDELDPMGRLVGVYHSPSK